MSDLLAHVEAAISAAWQQKSRLPPEALQLYGMSSPRVRHLLNNLCAREQTTYLEIGSWTGSTLISALYGNNAQACAIDNFSEFNDTGEVRQALQHNVTTMIPDHSTRLRFWDMDCFSLTGSLPFPISVYLYDGAHDTLSQYKGVYDFLRHMLPRFVLLVDDWNSLEVRAGTRLALAETGVRVLREWELPANGNGDKELWWNGFYVAVVDK